MYASTLTQAAYITIPTATSTTSTERELLIVNTSTPGVLIQGLGSSIAIGKNTDRMGTKFTGVIDLPVVLQGQVYTNGVPTGVGTDKLVMLPSANYVTNPIVPPETIQYYSKLDESITLASINSTETAFKRLKIKGSMISLMPQSGSPGAVQDDDNVTRVAIIEREGNWNTPIKIASVIGYQTVDNNLGPEYYHRKLEINSSQLTIRVYSTLTSNATSISPNSNWQFNATSVGQGSITFPNGTIQTGASISIADLKTLVAASTDFANFKSRIAALV
jgi:hypothetical protein